MITHIPDEKLLVRRLVVTPYSVVIIVVSELPVVFITGQQDIQTVGNHPNDCTV
jgi:hypothetical protein